MPREINIHINELQQTLLKDDCYIPNLRNSDTKDLARKSTVTATSHKEGYDAENVINGVTRAENAHIFEVRVYS